MWILIENTGDRRKIHGVSLNKPKEIEGTELVEVPVLPEAFRKKDCYYNYGTREVVLYTENEKIEAYRNEILAVCEEMGLGILDHYQKIIAYVEYKEARGDNIPAPLAQRKNDNIEKFINGMEWLRARVQALKSATTLVEIGTVYENVTKKYSEKREAVV